MENSIVRNFTGAALALALLCSPSALAGTKPVQGSEIGSAKQQSHLKERVRASIVIKAPPAVVWSRVLEYRRHDPEVTYFKPLTHEGDVTTIEEGFEFPTIFGSPEAKLLFTESAPHRVDFRLLESEDLKAMEGSWVITPAENGTDTILELSSFVHPYMPIPQGIVNTIIQHRLEKRVARVKDMAENPNSIGTKGPVTAQVREHK